MDPNVTLHHLLLAIKQGEKEEAADLAEALAAWVGKGGFGPKALAPCVQVAASYRY